MRVGIVVGGGAGLAVAWLLEEAHEVTLLEAERRLGGHAMTVEVPSAAGPRWPSTSVPSFSGPNCMPPSSGSCGWSARPPWTCR